MAVRPAGHEVKKHFRLVKYYNWLIFSIVNPQLQFMVKKYAHGKMADIGCGGKPYKEMASDFVSEHIGIDHEDTIHGKTQIDLIGSAYKIPTDDETFDCILCTYVLEHLEEPSTALAEAHRVLKKGGFAIYTVPFFWHLHEEPRDFYRFSKYGLKYLFEKNGFVVIELRALSGFIVTFAQEAAYFLVRFRGSCKANPLWWVIPPLVVLIQAVAYLLNKIDRSESFTVEYIIVARKNSH